MRTDAHALQLNGSLTEATSWRRTVARATAVYVLYIIFCFSLESYGRHAFVVDRDSAIAQLEPRRAQLLAMTRKATAIAEMEAWLPYRTYTVGSVTAWAGLAVAASFFAVRRLRRGGLQILRIDQYVLAIVLSGSFTLLLGLIPPVLIQKAWERYPWLSW